MATEVIMPKVDMVMETGTFVEWLKQEGDYVEKGEPLFVILTDKATIEIEAPASGILASVQAKPDDVIPVSQTIAYILEPGEKQVVKAKDHVKETLPPNSLSTGTLGEMKVGESVGKVRATPVARRVADELGIDLTRLAGRGPRGRIQRADVEEAVKGRAPEVHTPRPAIIMDATHSYPIPNTQLQLPDARQRDVIELAGPRKIIAERMAYSASVAPHINLSISVDMSEAARFRSKVINMIEQKTGRRLSYTAIIARALATILPRHPYLNASLVGERIILWDDVHLGIATYVDNYLVVPVIRSAQTKNLEQIVTVVGELVERARTKRLIPSEMTGSTFTISNLGMYGIESFTAIINPPESAILAVGSIVDTCVKAEQGVEFHPIMKMTVCADHRLVDGVIAANFLNDLKTTLENPYLLI